MKIQLQLIPAVLVFSAVTFAQPTQSSLKVGAAKVDVTPSQSELPQTHLGILDHIYVRAIVIDNGKTKAALVEVPGNPPQGLRRRGETRGSGVGHTGEAESRRRHAFAQHSPESRDWRTRFSKP